jgi:secreted Zn-dependent insulinase-like peptidase
LEYVEELAEAMQEVAPEHVLCGQHVFTKYDPDLIVSLINLLTPENVYNPPYHYLM